jgi:uncharacterized membrane protein
MPQGFTSVILLHVVAAVLAIGVGAFVFLRRKGTQPHRWMGRVWALLMLVVAISTYWITGIDGKYSWIHGLSVFVTVAVPLGVYYAVTGRMQRHRQLMSGLYIGALGIAGLFTLLPNRMLGKMLWGALGFI